MPLCQVGSTLPGHRHPMMALWQTGRRPMMCLWQMRRALLWMSNVFMADGRSFAMDGL